MTATYDKIATYTVPSSASSYTFSVIPATYTDIALIVGGTGSGDASIMMRFNGDTGSNYSTTFLYGTGSVAVSGRVANDSWIVAMGRINTTGGASVINIQNYSNTTTNKTVIGRGSGGATLVIAAVGLWRSTAAINSITLSPESSVTFATGTTFTLYGIKAE
jgi:hypothetical protein